MTISIASMIKETLKKKRAKEIVDGMWYVNMRIGNGPVGFGPFYHVCDYEIKQLEGQGLVNMIKVKSVKDPGMADITQYIKVDSEEGIPFNVRACSSDCDHTEK